MFAGLGFTVHGLWPRTLEDHQVEIDLPLEPIQIGWVQLVKATSKLLQPLSDLGGLGGQLPLDAPHRKALGSGRP